MEQKKSNIIFSVLLFVVTAILIAYFFPREGQFRYQFYEGKPWRYGLLTAPHNFPIYKTNEEVKAEKDSALKNFNPYYTLEKEVFDMQKERLREAFQNKLHNKVSSEYMQYIENNLMNLYNRGIIPPQELEILKQGGRTQVNLVTSNISQLHYVSDFFTVKSAYEFILDNAPRSLNRKALQSCDINDFLVENVNYNATMSDRVRQDILKSVAISNGLIQAGEKIVDRGELVDNRIYNVLRSYKIVYETKSGAANRQGLILIGLFVFVIGIILCYWLYLWSFRPQQLQDRKSIVFLLLCILMPCLLTEICVGNNLINVYIIPYAIAPIVVRTFFDSRTALFTHIAATVICALMVPFPFEFLVLQLIAGMVVTFSLKELSQRSQLIRCSLFIFVAYSVFYLSITSYQEGDFTKINWNMILYFGINFVLLMFTYVLVYFLEKAFGYVSSITLIELSNINTPVLKKLSETCPGTFQHSLQVSILASAAAVKIGANSQLVRTGTLYHDIGKMSSPAFFTENQNSVNPHNQLEFEESAQIIISHVTEGVKIAEKAALPEAIIDFIRTHHGKGLVKYFYTSFRNKYPDREINEALFTYPGPNPETKEQAVLMMADSVEAASRSLKEYTEDGICKLVNKIIDSQVAEGLLRMAPLTFRDVEEVKEVFIEKLKTMYHTRISYPELNKK